MFKNLRCMPRNGRKSNICWHWTLHCAFALVQKFDPIVIQSWTSHIKKEPLALSRIHSMLQVLRNRQYLDMLLDIFRQLYQCKTRNIYNSVPSICIVLISNGKLIHPYKIARKVYRFDWYARVNCHNKILLWCYLSRAIFCSASALLSNFKIRIYGR